MDYVNSGDFPNIKPRRFALAIGAAMQKGGELYLVAYPMDTGLKVDNDKVIECSKGEKQFHNIGIDSDKESVFIDWANRLNDSINGDFVRLSADKVKQLMKESPDKYEQYLERLQSNKPKTKPSDGVRRMQWPDMSKAYAGLVSSNDSAEIKGAITVLELHTQGASGWRGENRKAALDLISQLQERLTVLS